LWKKRVGERSTITEKGGPRKKKQNPTKGGNKEGFLPCGGGKDRGGGLKKNHLKKGGENECWLLKKELTRRKHRGVDSKKKIEWG